MRLYHAPNAIRSGNGLIWLIDSASSVNIISGYSGNTIAAGADACAIIGGGAAGNPNNIGGTNPSLNFIFGGYDNNNNGTIACGIVSSFHSLIDVGATHGFIGGGSTLTIGVNADYPAAVGGLLNSVSGDYGGAFVGDHNAVGGTRAVALGGTQGNASGASSLVLPGLNCVASGQYSYAGIANSIAGALGALAIGNNAQNYGVHAAVLAGDTCVAGSAGTPNLADYVGMLGGFANNVGVSASARFSFAGAGRSIDIEAEYCGSLGGQAIGLTGHHGGALAGQSNTISGVQAAAIAGTGLTVSGLRAIGLGGSGSTASAQDSLAGGTSSVAGATNAIAIAFTGLNYGASAALVGGNTITIGNVSVASRGDYAGSLGGLNNLIGATASARFSAALAGRGIDIEAEYCGTLAGQDIALSSQPYQSAVGFKVASSLYGAHAHASGMFATPGDNQHFRLIPRVLTTDATTTPLWLDGVSQKATLPDNTLWLFQIFVGGHRTDSAQDAGYIITGAIRRGSGAATTAIKGTPTVTTLFEDNAAWDVAAAANTANGFLQINVTGAAGATIRWGAVIELMQISG